MFYTIYKVTNMLDGKIYIGKHQTKDLDDGYMGSGKHLKRAIDKYGIENFTKEILYVFDNEAEMNAKEAELVTGEFVKEDTNYNLCPGGHGGFGYINANGLAGGYPGQSELNRKKFKELAGPKHRHLLKTDENYSTQYRKKMSEAMKRQFALIPGHWTGRTHSDETRKKMSARAKQRTTNSQAGTMWITNGRENKKIKKDVDFIPEGWYKGRVV